MKKTLLASIITITISVMPVLSDDAKTIYEAKCAACHGKDGKGDTKMGRKLEALNFTDPKVQEAMKDKKMIKAIKEGIKDGDKTRMPAFPKLSDEEIKTIIAYIRNLKANS